MNACPSIRIFFAGLLLLPVFAIAQNQYARTAVFDAERPGHHPTGEGSGMNRAGDGAAITSNVPLNEINIHAFRRFHRLFPAVSGESWLKSADGYVVSFMGDVSRGDGNVSRGDGNVSRGA